jgi:hypothetical protein
VPSIQGQFFSTIFYAHLRFPASYILSWGSPVDAPVRFESRREWNGIAERPEFQDGILYQ